MRVLLVTPYFYPAWRYGGPVKVTYDVSKELVKRGHEVTVYTSSGDNGCSKTDSRVKKVDGVQVRYFRNASALAAREMNLFITPEMIPVLKSGIQSFDIIHLHAYRSFQNMVTCYYARKSGVPYVLQAHGSLPRIMAKQRLKLIYDLLFGYKALKDASKVIALTRTEAQQYRYMGVPKEKIAIIPNGIDLSEYVNLPHKGSFKKKFNIQDDKKIILYLGRIHKTKGIDFLVKAYARLIRSLGNNNVILVIAGPDGGYLGKIRRLVYALGIVDKIMFTGTLLEKEKVSAYVDSDIVVNVEPRNVFGLVPLEALACSTPVIVSKGNAISEIIRHGKSGFSVKYGDVYELAETMRKMLNDTDQLSKMGQKGRKFVFENFDWADIVVKFEKIYEEIIASKNRCIKSFF
jgi:glycosyltransferase involved in cell wall biosynthesis